MLDELTIKKIDDFFRNLSVADYLAYLETKQINQLFQMKKLIDIAIENIDSKESEHD
jgi:hypothetical protein